MEWCLSPEGWRMEGEDVRLNKLYDITKLEEDEESREKYYEKIFYKEKYIESYDEERGTEFNQTLLVKEGSLTLRLRHLVWPLRRLSAFIMH